ncbi:MAG: hypothetical protein ACTSYF_00935 [Promethearchaeota archaeon]
MADKDKSRQTNLFEWFYVNLKKKISLHRVISVIKVNNPVIMINCFKKFVLTRKILRNSKKWHENIVLKEGAR